MTSSDDPAGKRRVLVADDVAVTASLMATVLAQAGFETAVAHDGEQCLELVESFKPHLVVLDLMMPKVHGIEVLQRLKAQDETRRIEVIICTGKGFRTEIARVEELGASDLLLKPFYPKDLVAKVEYLLRPERAAASGQALGPPAQEPVADDEIFLPRLDQAAGCLRFWGTRGSIPVSGPQCIRHGGNTCCVQLLYGDEPIIFDAGSGIRNLGRELAAGEPGRIHLFITHTHWDHIQGFPFFAPAFTPGFEIVVYGARGFNKDLESLLRGQLDPDYFPIQMENMDAELRFVYLDDQPIRIGDVEITWEYTQHPGATVGYKIETPEKKVAFVPDNEIFQGYMGPPDAIPQDHQLLNIYQPIIQFLTNVDVLIHEAQYTPEEYRQTVRYGHSSASNACFLAKITDSKRWIVIHHDPDHSDEILDDKLNLMRQILRRLGHGVEVSNGYDGLVECL